MHVSNLDLENNDKPEYYSRCWKLIPSIVVKIPT